MQWPLVARGSIVLGLLASIYFLYLQYRLFYPSAPTVVADRDLSSSLIDTPQPRRNFYKLAGYAAHNSDNEDKYTYATMLCTPVPDERDPFWAATQSLVWRILWSDWKSRYPITVFTCPSTPRWQKQTLLGMGARVEAIELIETHADLHLPRWRDQLAKLNLWKHIEFKKIVFLDSDAFPIDNIDDLFNVQPRQCLSGERETCEYLFAGAEMSDTDHDLNGGVFVMSPSLEWHRKLLSSVMRTAEYDSRTAEQGLLDSPLAFGLKGTHPRETLPQTYNADKEFYERNRFVYNDSSIRVLHCKMWSPLSTLWAPEMSVRWDVDWMTMSRFYDDPGFEFARRNGRLKSYFEVVAEKEAERLKSSG